MKASVPRTAAFSWSPQNYNASPMIASGTVAGALDESFSSDSVLELWKLPMDGADSAPSVQASTTASARFNRVAWGCVNAAKPQGLVAAGLENGELAVWDVQRLLEKTDDPLVTQNAIHKGPVRGLAFNRLHDKLLASGAVNGETRRAAWVLAA